MPAYRSPAEADIREPVVTRLRQMRPDHRIIHEINVCQGGNRIDLLSVGKSELIAVEIKSKKDKLDRAPAQIAAMQGVAHHAICAFHRKFLAEKEIGNPNVADFERDGAPFCYELPPEIPRHNLSSWVWPEPESGEFRFGLGQWKAFDFTLQQPLPANAIHMLWRDELWQMCGQLQVSANSRSTMHDMVRDLRWHCSGKELTEGICSALRRRKCVEADPPIQERI